MPTEHGFETEDDRNRATAEKKALYEAQNEARRKEQISPYLPSIEEYMPIVRRILQEYATAHEGEMGVVPVEKLILTSEKIVYVANIAPRVSGWGFAVYFVFIKAPNVEIIIELSDRSTPVDIDKLCSVLNRNTKLSVTLRVRNDNLERIPSEMKVAPVHSKTWIYDNEEQRIDIVRDPKIQAELDEKGWEDKKIIITTIAVILILIWGAFLLRGAL